MHILHATPGSYPAIAWGGPTKVVYQNSQPAQQGSAGGYFDLVFVGRLISRKGWDILLYTLRGPKDRDCAYMSQVMELTGTSWLGFVRDLE